MEIAMTTHMTLSNDAIHDRRFASQIVEAE
jgi:hypothetical protein